MKELLELQKNLQAFERTLQNIRSQHLNTQKLKDDIRVIIQYYFKNVRPTYLSSRRPEAELSEADAFMQDLLRCAQKRTLVSAYKRLIKSINKMFSELEVKSLPFHLNKQKNISDDTRFSAILDTLKKFHPSAALSYEQAMIDLNGNDRKSWRGTAVEFRESLREVLDILAPDQDVKTQPGFKLEPNVKGPTMKQKTVFILKAREASNNQIKPLTDAVNVIEELIGKFIRSVYERSSIATHTHTSKEEVLKTREYVSLALIDLLEIKL
ncbi:MAG: hypothetical protein HY096_01610 [Nitrospinae bacterium]|nr:hypothetical protein [Nitrospinota bacterium]